MAARSPPTAAACCCASSVRQFAACFRDYRQPAQVEHSVRELVSQRVYGLALGYEDLNDHDQLRSDPLLALLSGKQDLEGKQRRRRQDRGNPGAGKSTLNVDPGQGRSEKQEDRPRHERGGRLLTSLYTQSSCRSCTATKRGVFFTAYGHIATCRHFRRGAAVRAPAAVQYRRLGGGEEVRRNGDKLRRTWPKVEILLRADSGFCRDEIMSWLTTAWITCSDWPATSV